MKRRRLPALLGAALFACHPSAPPPPATAPPEPATPPTSVPGVPAATLAKAGGAVDAGLPRFALGINEAFAVPMRQRETLSADEIARAIEGDARQVRRLGATWVRGHTANFPRASCDMLARDGTGLAEMDLWVRTLGADLHGVAMLGPWPGNATARHTESYVPTDLAAYSACITRLVERYDGDGVDDMPGLVQPVHHWEFDNEPDLKNSMPARDVERHYDPATFCTPGEYAQVLLATSRAVRAADPDARILALGLLRPHAEQGQRYAASVLAVPGVPEAFDIVSLHTYQDDDGDRLAAGIAAIRALTPGKPIWVTEASVTSDAGEEEQGRRVAAYAAQAAAAGAEALFWHTLADPPAGAVSRDAGGRAGGGPGGRQGGGPGGRRGGGGPGAGGQGGPSGRFSTNSLLRGIAGGAPEEKAAGAVYRALAAELASADLRGAQREGDGAVKLRTGEVLLYRGERAAPAGGTNLRDGAAIAAGATARAPAWLRPSR